MANKALAKRQKLTIRIEPSQKALKPRNPLAAARKRVAGPHQKTVAAQRPEQKRLLNKKMTKPEEE